MVLQYMVLIIKEILFPLYAIIAEAMDIYLMDIVMKMGIYMEKMF